MFPLTWNICKSNLEYQYCQQAMDNCYQEYMFLEECPLQCKQELYIGQKRNMNGFSVKSKSIFMRISYTSMETEIHEEVLIQELCNFIGTVGRSLGLFIGFSVTGFIEKILCHFMKDSHKTDIIMGPPNYLTPTTT